MKVLSDQDEKILRRLIEYAGDSTIVDAAIERMGRRQKYTYSDLIHEIDEIKKVRLQRISERIPSIPTGA